MLLRMKYCILCIKRLLPNFASNIKQSFKGINQKLIFPLKIPWFSEDFKKNKSLILTLEAKLNKMGSILKMNTPHRKSICLKLKIETPEQTVKFA